MVLRVIIVLLSVVAVLYFGKMFTDEGMAWYATLTKPALTPPDIWFSIVWTAIFVLIIVCVVRIWQRRYPGYRVILSIFALNGLLNVAWSYFFFAQHAMLWAFADLVLLWISICYLMALLKLVSRWDHLLLLPYALWVAFAGYLNLAYWLINT